MERKWTADNPKPIKLKHKLYYSTQSNIDRIHFDLGFQAFVRRGEGKFSIFSQLSDINATLVASNLEIMFSKSYALLENNRAMSEKVALSYSAIYTAREQARSRRRAYASEDDSDGDDERNDVGDGDDVNNGDDGDCGEADDGEQYGGEEVGGEGHDGGYGGEGHDGGYGGERHGGEEHVGGYVGDGHVEGHSGG